MKKKRFAAEQIVAILKQAELGIVKGGVKPDQRGGAKIDHCDGGKG